MKKLFVLSVICLILFTNIDTAYAKTITTTKTTTVDNSLWPESEDVYSDSAILMDASTGLILYEKNVHDRHYPASITKIMTTLLAIENCSLNEIVSFSKTAIFGIERDSSHIGIDVGEELTIEQSLYGIMLASANEVAYGVAEHVSGDLSSFAKLMNQKAKELGCTDTNFVNANGLHDDNHYTTAYDMALIAKSAINNPIFQKVTSTISYTIPPTNIQEESRYLTNHHKMLKKTSYQYDGCVGGKTGYTTKSNHTLVTFAKCGDLKLICVIMNSDLTHQYTDTAKLFDFGFNNFTAHDISLLEGKQLLKDSPFFTKFNCLFCETTSPLNVSTNGYIILPNTANINDVTKEVNFNQKQNTSLQIDTIGVIKYSYGGKIVGSSDIEYSTAKTPELAAPTIGVSKSDTNILGVTFSSHDKNNFKPIIGTIIIAMIILSIILYYIFIEKPRLKKKKAYYQKKEKRNDKLDNDFIDLE